MATASSQQFAAFSQVEMRKTGSLDEDNLSHTGSEQVGCEDANEVHLAELQEKRQKALAYVEEIINKTLHYTSFLHNRISAEANNVTKKIEEPPAKKRKRNSQNKHSSQDNFHPLLFTGGVLHPHQLEGFHWLRILFENGLSCILADEMGLGKTAQAIAVISHMLQRGAMGPIFVCAPLSTLHNWYLEFKRFTPEVPVIVYHGNKKHREALRKNIQKTVNVCGVTCLPVFILSYETILSDFKWFTTIHWRYFVIDEGHRIKNFKSKLFCMLKGLQVKSMLIMTGTPLQNDMSELWALLNIALPEIFKNLEGFQSLLDLPSVSAKNAGEILAFQEQRDNLVSKIHQILTPFFLRRTKKDVHLHIPPKKEVIVYSPLTTVQKQYYQAIMDGTIYKLFGKKECDAYVLPKDSKRKSRKPVRYLEPDSDIDDDLLDEDQLDPANLVCSKCDQSKVSDAYAVHLTTNITAMLRKVCMHPYLIRRPVRPGTKELKVDEELIKCCGKLRILDAILPALKEQGHKVLIFSQFVKVLDILVEYCILKGFNFNRVDGQMPLDSRISEIETFDQDSSSFLFLLSTRAGGLGINLTSADTVILYDSDWNPQRDLQAQDRCHRIGQTKPVVVYRLVCKDTIDEQMVNRATAKRKLEKLIITDGRFNTNDTLVKSQEPLSEKELLEVLRSCEIKEVVECNEDKLLSKKYLKILLDRSDLEKCGSHSEIEGVFKVVS